jgi:hypothetical protein
MDYQANLEQHDRCKRKYAGPNQDGS